MEKSEDLRVLMIHDPNHRDGFGIGQRMALSLNDVYNVVKYALCADLSGDSLCS